MKREYAREYEDTYRRHWWFRSREAILLSTIRSLRLSAPATILDVGCGNGLFFSQLEAFGDVRGIEIDRELIPEDSPYRDRIFCQPLGDPCYSGMSFDLITALDVIEHIQDDRKAIRDMLAMLRPSGTLVITVPALMMLWDHHDKLNLHYRRYSKSTLRSVLPADVRILDFRYLFHALVIPKLLFKAFNAGTSQPRPQHGLPPVPIGAVMKMACVWEYWLLRWFRIPFGTSLLLVIQKAA